MEADILDRASRLELENTEEFIRAIQDKVPQPLTALEEPLECLECGEEIETTRALLGYTNCIHCQTKAETRSKTHWSK